MILSGRTWEPIPPHLLSSQQARLAQHVADALGETAWWLGSHFVRDRDATDADRNAALIVVTPQSLDLQEES